MSHKQDVRVMVGQPDRMTTLLTSANSALVEELPSTTDILYSFILARLPEPDTPLAGAALHHFATPGKMVRAKMALRAANLLKIDVTAALHWAVAIEVLHNASLIHDDICDGDQLRRNRPSVWSLYGQNVALTLGDWLIALAFELAAEAGQRSQTPLLVKILAQHMATTTAGEAAEFLTRPLFDWDSYLTIAADKTAPLLTAPLEGVAAMALHANASAAIGTYFRSLGTAYQIANDILNFRALDGAANCGSDLARRAPNAVIVLYRQNLTSVQANVFDEWFLCDDNAALCVWQEQILKSDAMALSAHHMHKTLDQTVRYAQVLPAGLVEVIAPVQALLKQVCLKSVAPVKC